MARRAGRVAYLARARIGAPFSTMLQAALTPMPRRLQVRAPERGTSVRRREARCRSEHDK